MTGRNGFQFDFYRLTFRLQVYKIRTGWIDVFTSLKAKNFKPLCGFRTLRSSVMKHAAQFRRSADFESIKQQIKTIFYVFGKLNEAILNFYDCTFAKTFSRNIKWFMVALLKLINYSSIKRQLAKMLTRAVSKHPSINERFIAVQFNTHSDVKRHTDCLATPYLPPPFIF